MAPSHHGTTVNDAFGASPHCTACDQQNAGSAFLAALNNPGETPGDVDYTQVEVRRGRGALHLGVPPGRAEHEHHPPAPVPGRHRRAPHDPDGPEAIAWVLDAFDHDGPANTTARMGCAG